MRRLFGRDLQTGQAGASVESGRRRVGPASFGRRESRAEKLQAEAGRGLPAPGDDQAQIVPRAARYRESPRVRQYPLIASRSIAPGTSRTHRAQEIYTKRIAEHPI
jgi:hypothetical protein